MKFIISICLALVAIYAATFYFEDPEAKKLRIEHENNIKEQHRKNHPCECVFLFEFDGIKVYRFYDNSHYRYFTSKGEMSYDKRVGKSIYNPETL